MARTLLFVFAHPDDETFLTGGVASKYTDEGVRVVLASATRGESGKVGDPPVCSREELPAVREEELRRAAAILGIAECSCSATAIASWRPRLPSRSASSS